MGKNTKDDLYKLSPVEVYTKVLSRELKRFPNGFWLRPEAEQNAIEVIKYWVEVILKWNDGDITSKFNTTIFAKNSLGSMLQQVFDGNPYESINKTYPDRFKVEDFKSVHQSYWNKRKICTNTNSAIKIFELIQQNKLRRFPNKYWDLESSEKESALLVKYLINAQLHKSNEDLTAKFLKRFLKPTFFKKHKLDFMFEKVYDNNIFLLVNTVYPDKFKIWEINNCYGDYWTEKRKIEAVKWLIEEKMKLDMEDVKNSLNISTFTSNGLNGITEIYLDLDQLLKRVYPD